MGPLFSNKVKMLADRLTVEKYPHMYDKDNNLLILPRAEANIPDVPEQKFYISSVSNKGDIWAIVFQVAIRAINDTDPKFSEKNTSFLLEEAARLYRERQPSLHAGKGAPLLQWEIDLTYVDEHGFRYGALDGIVRFKGTVQDAYSALTLIGEIPSMELVEEVKDDSSHPQDAIG